MTISIYRNQYKAIQDLIAFVELYNNTREKYLSKDDFAHSELYLAFADSLDFAEHCCYDDIEDNFLFEDLSLIINLDEYHHSEDELSKIAAYLLEVETDYYSEEKYFDQIKDLLESLIQELDSAAMLRYN